MLKPVSREWLVQKYTIDGLSTRKIASIVNRDPKTVYDWLISLGIEPRRRRWDISLGKYPFHEAHWLYEEYTVKGRSAQNIADEFNVSTSLIYYFLKRNAITRRKPGGVHGSRKTVEFIVR